MGGGRQGECPLDFAASFEGSVPDREALPLVFNDPPFRIRRGSLAGSHGMADWLAQWETGGSLHFKVIQISAMKEPEQAYRLTVLVDRTDSSGLPPFQENAAWLTEWESSDEAGKWALKRVETPFYEWVEDVRETAPTLYADATASVFQGDPVFQRQLSRGIDY